MAVVIIERTSTRTIKKVRYRRLELRDKRLITGLPCFATTITVANITHGSIIGHFFFLSPD